MVNPRDSQRKRVYEAEDSWIETTEKMTLAEIDEWINKKILGDPWFYQRYRDSVGYRVRIEDGRGLTSARANDIVIQLPTWTRLRGLVLHELAHTVMTREYGQRFAWHGPEFCRVYLDLVEHYMGFDEAMTLRKAFRSKRVRVALRMPS